MTNWTNINHQFCNRMIDELIKPKPFDLVLFAGDAGSLFEVAKTMQPKLNNRYVDKLVDTLSKRVQTGTGITIVVNDSNADILYHMLSSYLLLK